MEHVHKSASHTSAVKNVQSMQQGAIPARMFQFKYDRPEVSMQRNIQSLADHPAMNRFSICTAEIRLPEMPAGLAFF